MPFSGENMTSTVYRADRIFDGERVLTEHAVLVDDKRIVDVVPLSDVASDLPVEEHAGCTLLPGLIDTHMHFMGWQGAVFLAYGVTTIRDAGNDLSWILQCREEWRQRDWPRIISLGPLLDGTPPNHDQVARAVSDTDSAVAAVIETAAAGADGIKLYASIAAEWIEPMVEASHAAGLKASMHCLPHGVLVAARAGIDEFYHLDGILADVWPDRPPGWLNVWGDPGFDQTWDRQQEVADTLATTEIVSTPTLAYWDSQWCIRVEGPYPQERRYMPDDLFEWSSATPDAELGAMWRRAWEAALAFQGLLNERGVPTLAGSDTPCGGILPGQSLWRELQLLVATGLSSRQALTCATSAAADFLDRPELGRLREGAHADLVIVGGDPTEAIPDQPDVRVVVRDGVRYNPDELLRPADTLDSTWRDEPWGRQFAQHGEKRRAQGD